jgi:hypothetical protein
VFHAVPEFIYGMVASSKWPLHLSSFVNTFELTKAADRDKSSSPTVVVMAPPHPINEPPSKSITPAIDAADVARLLQFHLKRVGCDPGAIEGFWSDGARRALEQFNRRTGTKFDVKVATIDALDALKAQTARVCPLVCDTGYRMKNDHCVPEPKAASKPKKTPGDRPTDAARASGDGQGQVICDRGGCKSVPKNCRLAIGTRGDSSSNMPQGPQSTLVCN